MSTQRKATLTIEGQNPVDFPIMSGTHGNDVIDIRTLGGKTGLFTYDSGEFEANMVGALKMIDYAGFAARRKESEARTVSAATPASPTLAPASSGARRCR